MTQHSSFPADPKLFAVVDVGSTTTKVVLFRREREWRFFRAESPTTVEKPHEDVSVGLLLALGELARKTGERLVESDRPAVPLLATSSAGGGLAMVVAGLVRDITAQSADRAALGAGAILLDTLALNDGRTPYRKIEDLKTRRPDMILLAGGFDADNITGPVFLAELLVEAGLCPKLNPGAKLPVIYAGNRNAREQVRSVLGDRFLIRCVDNIRPDEATENYGPCRRAIHELFMDHVMSHAPGFERLVEWTLAPVVPTPAAFARAVELLSEATAGRVLALDIGGATTDVFSAEHGRAFRTVSANIGLSYSILKVAELAGPAAIIELLGDRLEPEELWNRIGTKHVNPTSLPATALDMRIEWATAAVALREAVRDHFAALHVGGSKPAGDIDVNDLLRECRPSVRPRPPVTLEPLALVIGSGGILSHSPGPAAVRMLVAGLAPPAGAELAVDNEFILPHLGVLASVNESLARQLLDQLGLVRLGPASAPPAAWPGDYLPPPRAATRAAEPTTGPVRLKRELAIPGNVLVRTGEPVKTDTVIARSTRLFLRPFFLPVAASLGVRPEKLPEHMRKRVGDEIALNDIVASRPRRVAGHKAYHSPVDGRIEKLLPGGIVLVRERPEAAREYTTVDVARELKVEPDEVGQHLRVGPGDEVERGQWLAATINQNAFRFVASPVRGRVNRVIREFGMVVIEPLLEELAVRAWLPGVVEGTTERGAVVAGSGLVITGIWGRGDEAQGTLDFGPPRAGRIHVAEFADRALLRKLAEAGAAGLVCAGANLGDILDPEPGFSLVVTTGFGRQRFAPDLLAALRARADRLALVDGRTQLRVGVRRPFVILPD